jgi:hypothetical protein
MKRLALAFLSFGVPPQCAGAVAPSAPCAQCHRAETSEFTHARMTRALESGKDSSILQAHPKLAVRLGVYTYEIAQAGVDFIYTVSNGKETVRAPIEWAFGQGAAGQTFLYRRGGSWYESRVSYFSALNGLDLTMGAQSIAPHGLQAAAGRLVEPLEAGKCFDCHATNVVRAGPDISAMTAGVWCERCHGLSQEHLRGRAMTRFGAFTTEEMSDFCGQCHRTWSEVSANGPRGIQNVRFQPYRLSNSKCYDAADNRIRCTACHDPHRDLETSAGAYDARCAACHSSGASPSTRASTHTCPVAAKDCVTCHMPRLDLPGAHKKFTDHRIRVAKANEQYPD